MLAVISLTAPSLIIVGFDTDLQRPSRLRAVLGGDYRMAPKPKGMWQRTYQRKRLEIVLCENQADQDFIAKFAHLLSAAEREIYCC